MKRTPHEILNKEKVIFILLALVFSAGVYSFFASRPAELQPGRALTALSSPANVKIAAGQDLRAERNYLRGDRNNPFSAPQRLVRLELPEPPENPKKGGGPIDPPPKDKPEKPEIRPAQIFNPRAMGIEYIGIAMTDGKSCALLRTRGNSRAQRVIPGEKITGTELSVARVEQWEVWLSDGTSTSVLRNERYASRSKPMLKPTPGVPF